MKIRVVVRNCRELCVWLCTNGGKLIFLVAWAHGPRKVWQNCGHAAVGGHRDLAGSGVLPCGLAVVFERACVKLCGGQSSPDLLEPRADTTRDAVLCARDAI